MKTLTLEDQKSSNRQLKIVVVEWNDAWNHSKGHTPIPTDLSPMVLTSAGFLIKDEPEYVMVAGELREDDNYIDYYIYIPRSIIKSITVIGVYNLKDRRENTYFKYPDGVDTNLDKASFHLSWLVYGLQGITQPMRYEQLPDTLINDLKEAKRIIDVEREKNA